MSAGADRPLPPLPLDERGAVVTIGNFDGVHLGHQAVLGSIAARAVGSGRRSVLVTFDPHPLRVLRPEAAPPLLTTTAEKKEALACSGIEYAILMRFDDALRQLSARSFVEEILLARLGMRELVIGYDHAFGRDREGDAAMMRRLGDELAFEVHMVDEVATGSAPVSSSRIRRAVAAGEMEHAAEALGRRYSLQGRVVEGMKQGRALGFPTANITIDDAGKLLPLAGIYAVYGLVGGERLPGLLHLGPRPTFAGFPASVELHLLDWQGDLYDRVVRVEFVARLRGVERFDSADALIAQMHRDADAARPLFAPR